MEDQRLQAEREAREQRLQAEREARKQQQEKEEAERKNALIQTGIKSVTSGFLKF